MEDPTKMLHDLEGKWSGLTIADDFVFGKVMLDEGICREVIEAILGVPIERIEYVGREESLDASPQSKAVRLDAYVRDEAGTVYNVEMQKVDTRELPQRSRYYQSLMTVDQLRRGERYRTLRDAYVIFVCGFDPFGLGRRVYSFQNMCRDVPGLELGDGAHVLFLSSTAHERAGSAGVDELLDYIAAGTVSGELSSRLDAAVDRVLDDRKLRLEYMWSEVRDQLNIDKGRDIGLEQGRAEGLERGRAEGMEQGRAEGMEQGRAEGLERGLEQGRTEGEKTGRAQGESRLAKLVSTLAANGRTDEALRVASDEGLRERLYKELGI